MASSLRFECPKCGGSVRAPARQAGEPCICPKCNAKIRAPGGQAGAEQNKTPASSKPSKPAPAAKPNRAAKQVSSRTDASTPPAPQAKTQRAKPAKTAAAPPPTAPRKKKAPPKKEEPLRVVCRICGTRMFAQPSEEGSQLQCPDCGTANVVTRTIRGGDPDPSKESEMEIRLKKDPDPALQDATSPLKVEISEDGRWEYADPEPEPESPPAETHASQPPPEIAEEFPVTCTVCGSRMLATHDRVGQTIKCPDCFTVNEILAPRVTTKARPPALDDEEVEFKLSDPIDRPAYDPISRPEIDSDAEAPAGASSETGAFDRQTRADKVAAQEALARAEAELREQERQDTSRQDAALMKGVLDFFRYPSTLGRIAGVAIAAGITVSLLFLTVEFALSEGSGRLMVVLTLLPTIVLLPATIAFTAACVLAITIDSGNGNNEVTSWPDWDFIGWLPNCFFLVIATLYAAVPGLAISSVLQQMGLSPVAGLIFQVISLWLLFPPVLLGMLDNDSYLVPFSKPVRDSFKLAPDAWVLFYFETLALLMLSTIAWGMLGANWRFTSLPAAAIITTLMFCYFRLLGRMAWICQDVTSVERETPDDNQSS